MSGPIEQPTPAPQPVPQQPAPQQANPYSAYPPPPAVPVFQVTTMSHIGALIFWYNQRRTTVGTYDQCRAAMKSAQTQNFIVGWWSILSILILNWVAIIYNANAMKRLDQDAQQAHEYAQWWHTYVGPSRS